MMQKVSRMVHSPLELKQSKGQVIFSYGLEISEQKSGHIFGYYWAKHCQNPAQGSLGKGI